MKKSKQDGWVKIGDCAVDSGQLVLVDPCYIMPRNKAPKPSDQLDYMGLLKARGFDLNNPLNSKTQQTQQVTFSGIAGDGVVFDSGIGDGVYPVYAKFVDDKAMGRRVAEVKVVMMPHPYFK